MMLSHFGTKTKSRDNNILRFTPPGFKTALDVPFPPRCLPVCAPCKKNFKTREHCRNRDSHTGLPWCDTYICMTLGPSCTDDKGELLETSFVAQIVEPKQVCMKGVIDPSTQICAPCKNKNYTRTYCRRNKKHRQVPWSTVYIQIEAAKVESADADGDKTQEPQSKRRKTSDVDHVKTTTTPKEDYGRDSMKREEEKPFEFVPLSRTFLAIVSSKSCATYWLDYASTPDNSLVKKENFSVLSKLDDSSILQSSPTTVSPSTTALTSDLNSFLGNSKNEKKNDLSLSSREQLFEYRAPPVLMSSPDILQSQMFRRHHFQSHFPYNNLPPSQEMIQSQMHFEAQQLGRMYHSDMSQNHVSLQNQLLMQRMQLDGLAAAELASKLYFENMARASRGGLTPRQNIVSSQIPPQIWPQTHALTHPAGVNRLRYGQISNGAVNLLDRGVNHASNRQLHLDKLPDDAKVCNVDDSNSNTWQPKTDEK